MPGGLFSKRVHDTVGLSMADRQLLTSLRVKERKLDAREQLYRAGDATKQCAVVRTGFLASQKTVSDHREQILAFHAPGDFPDLQMLHLPALDHSIISVGTSDVGLVAHEDLKDLLAASPKLANVFWRETIIEATILREWVCNGARDALASVAHLICELAFRLDAVGLVKENNFYLPLTQEDIANATGISPVHANRVLQDLRRRRLISWERRTMTLLNFQELERIAVFEPEYLSRKISLEEK
jgi:CRP-like cAMP-binding protein